MAQVILSQVGQALGGPVGGFVGAALGGAIDSAVVGSLRAPRQVGPRLPGLRVTSTADGAPMACVFGRARVAGQVIWAARFREQAVRGGSAKGGRTVEHRYSLSFAVALCEGPIDGVGRVWADGRPMDMTGVTMRVHRGTEDQTPDALIEAVEGAGAAPAFRGTAYVVFEDLPLEAYGNRAPQLSFEVFRRPEGDPDALEKRLTGVCLIPGAGEFVYAAEPVLRRSGLTRSTAENANNGEGRPDLLVSLDQLEAQLPKVTDVTLVVTWFGDDLRAGSCTVKPGVERRDKVTIPQSWSVAGLDRSTAHLISGAPSALGGGPSGPLVLLPSEAGEENRPNYGGTPSDESVKQAIAALKARGWRVTLYPFLMMDVPPGNALPDPYGGAEQAAFPWRGRIIAPDGAGATAAVAGFFGGAGDWGWRRCVRHYAELAVAAGGVDAFLIGSELRGLTTLRDGAGAYPAVAELKALAAECRAILGADCAISYAADWTEYFGHQPPGGDVRFHLDPLWADPNVDFVGIDWYPPLADWRDGGAGLDALAGWGGPRDRAYLQANVAGGERFDWYYASEADRLAQVRSPITDGAHGEPWVFRVKDLIGWWSNAHHERIGGVRQAAPTAWIPQGKPIRFVEFGCPAADKGANSPNLFFDPKSAESALPPFSNGGRDDLEQRRALEAVLAHFGEAANNPTSAVYGGPMLEGLSAWCWDARPFPDFPGRESVWADGANWALGHWLNGRTGVAPARELVAAVLARGGVGEDDADLSEVSGSASGYVIERPMSVRDALAPLAVGFGFELAEADGRVRLAARDGPAAELAAEALAWPEDAPAPVERSRRLEPAPDGVRVRFVNETADYQTGAAGRRADDAAGGGVTDLDLPLVTDAAAAEGVAARVLRRAHAERDAAVVHVGPLEALRRTPGDRVTLAGLEGAWRVTRVDADERPRLTLARCEAPDAGALGASGWTPGAVPAPAGPPALFVLELPGQADVRPLIAAAAEPWRPLEVWAGADAASLTVRARVEQPAVVGALAAPLAMGAAGVTVRLEGAGTPSAGTLAVRAPSGEWEVLAFAAAELVGAETWALTGLSRGLQGSDPAAAEAKPAGAAVVLLTDAAGGELPRAEVSPDERSVPLLWRAAPAGGPPGGLASEEVEAAWTGLARRPWAPGGLSAALLAGGGVRFSWTRRGRPREGPVDMTPVVEPGERWLAEALAADATVLKAWETAALEADWPATEVVAAGVGSSVRLRVRGGNDAWPGWGPATEAIVSW